MTNIEEILAPFKTDQDPLGLIFLIDNVPAMKLVAAWPNIIRGKYIRRKDPPPNDDQQRVWEWIWAGVRVDMDKLAIISGTTAARTEHLYTMLWVARIIFPDGSVHPQARNIVAQYIQKKVIK